MTNEPLRCQMCGRTLPDSEDVVFRKCDFCGAMVLRSQQNNLLVEDALLTRKFAELVGMVERLIALTFPLVHMQMNLGEWAVMKGEYDALVAGREEQK